MSEKFFLIRRKEIPVFEETASPKFKEESCSEAQFRASEQGVEMQKVHPNQEKDRQRKQGRSIARLIAILRFYLPLIDPNWGHVSIFFAESKPSIRVLINGPKVGSKDLTGLVLALIPDEWVKDFHRMASDHPELSTFELRNPLFKIKVIPEQTILVLPDDRLALIKEFDLDTGFIGLSAMDAWGRFIHQETFSLFQLVRGFKSRKIQIRYFGMM